MNLVTLVRQCIVIVAVVLVARYTMMELKEMHLPALMR